MAGSLSQRLVARYAAVLMALSGIVSLANHPLPKLAGMSNAGVGLVSGLCLASAVVVWLLPWHRWPRLALYAIVPFTLVLKMVANHLGGVGPYGYGLHYVLIFAWIGFALPQWTSFATTPLLVIAYLLPLWARGAPGAEISSVAVVVPICLIVGESIAWVATRLRYVERTDATRMRRMADLVHASVELARRHDARGLADLVARQAAALLGGDRAVVLLLDARRRLCGAGGYAWPADPRGLVLHPDEHPALARALRRKEIVDSLHRADPHLAESLDLPTVATIPLIGSGPPVGVVLVALRDRREVEPFTAGLARTFATQAALATERLRATQALVDASLHDELTGVGNRRKAKAALRALNPGDALMLLDLDHFKRVNDSRGHAVGDAALRALGDHLLVSVREGDEVFRWGGEEFLVVLGGVGDGAEAASRRLCEGWRRLDPITTFSAGVAVHRASQDAEQTLQNADTALYAAKEAGRDRVHLHRAARAENAPPEADGAAA